MNQLATENLDRALLEIRENEDLPEIIAMIRKIDALKTALEAVGTFREQAVKYARLEAEALLRVAALGGISSLRGLHRQTAEWLATLSEEEVEDMIGKCAEGLTIDQVYKREFGANADFGARINEAKSYVEEKLQELKSTGSVNISDVTRFIETRVKDKVVATALTDNLRIRLRQTGAVCVEESSGNYIIPGAANEAEIKSAILMRYESVVADIMKMKEICKAAKMTCSFRDFLPKGTAQWNELFYGSLLLTLSAAGILDGAEEDEMYRQIAKTDFQKEMDYASKNLRMSREKIIEAEYRGIAARRAENGGAAC